MRLVLCLLSFITSLFSLPSTLDVQAHSAILMNAETGRILYEKHARIPWAPASTTKIGLALYLLDNDFDLDRQVTVSKEALQMKKKGQNDPMSWWLESDGIMLGLKKGEIVSLSTLLHAAVMYSANDAANVIAERIGGTIPDFMAQLNSYLKSIGCKNTEFSNPHGLTHEKHFTTAYDLAWMMKRALGLPEFRKIIKTLKITKEKSNKQPETEILLTNLMMKPESRYYYPKAIGGKTGYTKAAMFNLVIAAKHEDRTLIAVLLGSENKNQRYLDAKKLFEMAFRESQAKRRLIGPEQIFSREIIGSNRPLKATLIFPLSISFYPSEEPKCKAALHWKVDSVPIQKGQKVGEIHILDEENRLLEKGNLVAKEEIRGNIVYLIKDKIAELFR